MITCPTCEGSDLTRIEEVVDLHGEGPKATRWAERHTCRTCSARVYHVIDSDTHDEWMTVRLGGDARGQA